MDKKRLRLAAHNYAYERTNDWVLAWAFNVYVARVFSNIRAEDIPEAYKVFKEDLVTVVTDRKYFMLSQRKAKGLAVSPDMEAYIDWDFLWADKFAEDYVSIKTTDGWDEFGVADVKYVILKQRNWDD